MQYIWQGRRKHSGWTGLVLFVYQISSAVQRYYKWRQHEAEAIFAIGLRVLGVM